MKLCKDRCHDSFTYNLIHQVQALGFEATLLQSDVATLEQIEEISPKAIILSAGPKTPAAAGITLEVVAEYIGKLPMLGVCLGFQALGQHGGANLVEAKELIHGRAVSLKIEDCRLFKGVKNPLFAARYNSLVLETTPQGFDVVATDDHGQIMAIEHQDYPVFGVQFHLESFMTKQGSSIMRNFLMVPGLGKEELEKIALEEEAAKEEKRKEAALRKEITDKLLLDDD